MDRNIVKGKYLLKSKYLKYFKIHGKIKIFLKDGWLSIPNQIKLLMLFEIK